MLINAYLYIVIIFLLQVSLMCLPEMLIYSFFHCRKPVKARHKILIISSAYIKRICLMLHAYAVPYYICVYPVHISVVKYTVFACIAKHLPREFICHIIYLAVTFVHTLYCTYIQVPFIRLDVYYI